MGRSEGDLRRRKWGGGDSQLVFWLAGTSERRFRLHGTPMIKTHFASLLVALVFGSLAPSAMAAEGGLNFYRVDTWPSYSHITWMADLNELTLRPTPFLSLDDIAAYDWSTHTVFLKPESESRLVTEFGCGTRHPIVNGLFVVTVDSARVYMGLLSSMLSSYAATDVPVVTVPCLGDCSMPSLHINRAQNGPDTRQDRRIYELLERAGVLAEQ